MRCTLLSIILLCSIITKAQDQGTGLLFDDAAYLQVPKKAKLMRGDYSYLPENASIKAYAPNPGNQLVLNTSPAWAVTYSAKTILHAINHRLTDKSDITQNSFAPSFTYGMIKDESDKNCEQGAYLHDALMSLKEDGAPKYIDFQYFCSETISAEHKAKARSNKITDFSRIFDDTDSDNQKIRVVKKAIFNRFPVVVGMYTPPSFRTTKEFWQPRERFREDFEKQALCVVGYDDTKYGGAFEVLNSWGRNWGNEGYMWIPYKTFLEFTKYAFEVYDQQIDPDQVMDMGGEVVINLDDGGTMQAQHSGKNAYYKILQPYPTGTMVQIVVENQQTAYAYVIGTDLSYQWWQLFPDTGSQVSALLTYPSDHVALPGEGSYIQMQDPPGKDYLCVLYSKEELEIEEIVDELSKVEGDVFERINKVFGDKIVDFSNFKFDKSQVSFKGSTKGKTVLPLIIEIDHI